ncbi:MAG: DNA translocase FtsK 4TM domain-containing protein, partial [Alphaproteobacteria bacterium]|nr:DNA translocase FtsK 4TM domain-containing protein [Alphaproteobacteria bacterium]
MVSIDAGRSRTRHREGIHWLRLAMRLTGGLVLLAALFVGLALASYDRHDPSWNHAVAGPVTNLMALPGAQLADALLQAFGAAAVLVPLFLADWAARLMTGHGRRRFWLKLLLAPWTVPLAALALSILPAPWWWPIRSGIGGFIGQLARQGAGHLDIAPPLSAMAAAALVGTILLYVFGPSASTRTARAPREKPPSLRVRLLGWLPRPHLPQWRRVAVDRPVALETGPRREPLLLDATGAESFDDEPAEAPPRRSAAVDLPPRERKIKRLRQASLALDAADHVLPSLELLAEVPPTRTAAVNEEALQQNARLLESVLEDFGVRGQIVKVRPGPVVALYELEPAAGIKASRVIGLADDIARSMSALSARVAVIPGRSVLGIELPNARSEMVFLRELLASEAYERNSAKLPLVLGKDIGGAPVIADLQRMPHLLIAGTTGSGKSVGINTMILSVLYRLSSDQ